jgi:phytol kinase
MTLHDTVALAIVLVCALAMLFLLRIYRKWRGADGEWIRKLAHIGTGLLSISLPWVFSSSIPIFIICGASIVLLLAIRYLPLIHNRLSGVLDDVARDSWGEIYFPLSVGLLYYFANGSKLLYVVPLVVLSLADTVAALTGAEYGKHGYAATGATKSMEGSIAFFSVAFFSVNVALVVFSDAGRIETLLISLNIALIVMLLEAIAWRGLDNIFIPLGVFILLRLYLAMSLGQLWDRFRVGMALIIFVTLYARKTTLQGSALLASALVLYISWALGGWQWLLPPAILLLAYTLFFPGKITEADRTHNVYAVLSIASVGLVWLFLSRIWRHPEFLFPYTLAFAIHLAIIAWNLLYPRHPSARLVMLACVLVSWSLMFAPYLLIESGTRLALLQTSAALMICGVAFAAFYWLEPRRDGIYPSTGARWLRQAAIVLVSTFLSALFSQLGQPKFFEKIL